MRVWPRRSTFCRRRKIVFALVEREEDHEQQEDDADHQQAAFRTVVSAAPQDITGRRGGEQVTAREQAAIGRAVEVGFAPVPTSMAADGPPSRAGSPDADAKDKADSAGGKNADPVFAAIACMEKAEERGGYPGRLPKGGTTCSRLPVENIAGNNAEKREGIVAPNAVACGAHQQVKADGRIDAERPPKIDAAGERELQIAAEGSLFNAA